MIENMFIYIKINQIRLLRRNKNDRSIYAIIVFLVIY